MKKSKQHQHELPGMPKISALAEKATEYLNERDELQQQKDIVGEIKQKLAIEFQKAGLNKIRISGCTIIYKHKEADSITVKKDPENI